MDTNELAIYIRIYFILFFINFQIQNYVFLLKDVTKLHEPGAVVSETVSSEHDTVPCQIQTQNMSQHKRSKKHAGNVLALQTKFKVQDESITNKDYEALVAEKGWLSDSVSLVIQFKIIFILFYYLRL
jgi:hypothetical protein